LNLYRFYYEADIRHIYWVKTCFD